MTFDVGDTVVYPSQGAGVIDEITRRTVLGEEHEYLKIKFVRGEMEVLVPLKKGQEVGLRHTISLEEVSKIPNRTFWQWVMPMSWLNWWVYCPFVTWKRAWQPPSAR